MCPLQREADYVEAKSQVRLSARLARHQMKYGRFFLLEQPATWTMWEEPEIKQVIEHKDVYSVKFDMCMFGMNVDNKGYKRKPTRIVTSMPWLIDMLSGHQCDGKYIGQLHD